MEDSRIVDLYWARSEQAIAESDRKYGKLLRSVSYACLGSREDAEECTNDTYLEAWNAMPTARPDHLGAFLSKSCEGSPSTGSVTTTAKSGAVCRRSLPS